MQNNYNSRNQDKKMKRIIITFIFLLLFFPVIKQVFRFAINRVKEIQRDNSIIILSSYDNKDLEQYVKKYAKKQNISVEFSYMGDLDIVDELNNNSSDYDCVWISNSIWLYMLDNAYVTSESKSISISPVVMGIKMSKARELELIGKDIYNSDLLELITNKKVKYVMSSVTQTNTGATAYLGFLNTLAGNPEILTNEMLDNQDLINNMKSLFTGVERTAGNEQYLEEMFLNSTEYEAVIASESSLININKQLQSLGQETLYLLYPRDGVAITDSAFAYIDNGKNNKGKYLKLQEYLLSDESQKVLQEKGRRTWYGGLSSSANNSVFNKDWGINTNEYLVTTKYPSKNVMTKAINLYIEELRKPTHVVFCLDYSGSMDGEGISELRNAMNYILNYEEASKDKLQFSKYDKITIITFGNQIYSELSTLNGKETQNLINGINSLNPNGSTALYTAINRALDILSKESDYYTTTVIAMTDGAVNVGTFNSLSQKYYYLSNKIPIYSITFGDADYNQLERIAQLSNARVFNGKTNLLSAFKEVRGYN